MNRISRLVPLLLLCALAGAGAEVIDISGGWSYRFGDHSAWFDISLPFSPGTAASGGEGYLNLRRTVELPDSMRNPRGAVELYLAKTNGAVEVYADGVLVDYAGRGGENFHYHDAKAKRAVIPGSFFEPDGKAELEVRVFTESGVFSVPGAAVGTPGSFDGILFLIRFFGSDIYLVFSVLSLFIGYYFLQQYLFQRKEKTNLLFALANLSLFLYFFNMGFDYRIMDPVLLDRVAKSGLFLFFSFLSLFFVMFFDVHNTRPVRYVLGALGVLMAVPFYIFPSTIAESRVLFNTIILPGEALLLFIAYLTVRALVRRHPYALYIAVGVFFGFLFGSYDIYHAVLGLEPLVWLQGVGIFLFDLSMFFALAVRNMRMQEELRLFSAELASQRSRLENSFERVAETGKTVAGISLELDTAVKKAADKAGSLAATTDVIAESMQGQHELVTRTDESVERFLINLEETYRGLEKQNREVDETAATIEEMLENLEEVGSEVRETAAFTERLDSVTRSGADAMKRSESAMTGIREVSEEIYQIIAAVNDLAARTNLLAMNAAIEAAHAGDKGRGFAVVATEIKKLAEGSGAKTREIGQQVSSIIERIEEGVSANETVRGLLDSIRSDTAGVVEKVRHVSETVQEQRASSRNIQNALKSLSAASAAIKEQADGQGLAGREMKAALEELVGTSRSVLESTREMNEGSRAILEQVEAVARCSNESSGAVERLGRMIES